MTDDPSEQPVEFTPVESGPLPVPNLPSIAQIAGLIVESKNLPDGSAWSVILVSRGMHDERTISRAELEATVRQKLAVDLSKHLKGIVPPDDVTIYVADKAEDVPVLNLANPLGLGLLLASAVIYVGTAPPSVARPASVWKKD